MKISTISFRIASFALLLFCFSGITSCFDDHIEFAQMIGVNYFSRHKIITPEEITFDNSVGISDATFHRGTVVSIEPNSFVNEDGTAFEGKVYFNVTEVPTRGYMAMNSVPTVSNGNPLQSEGADFLRATDASGHDLKLASGKHMDVAVKGHATASVNQMYYGDDNVTDPQPNNTVLFNWTEASADTIEYYYDNSQSAYIYKLKPEQLGWVACSRPTVITNTTPVKVRVWGVHPVNYNNTAVYLVPKVGRSAYRLWNYDEKTNTFSGDVEYMANGSQFYVAVFAVGKHDKIYFGKEEFTAGPNTEVKTVTATEGPASGGSLNNVAIQFYYL